MTQADSPAELYCPDCGYNLHGIDSPRCPECGLEIDRSTLGQSILPWVNRERIGRIRAFWRTAEMATLRPQQLAREMVRPAQLAEALRFRRITCVLGMFALLPSVVIAAIELQRELGWALQFSGDRLLSDADWLGSMFHALILISCCVGAWLFLKGMTGIASYFFHPATLTVRQQNRAIALSYYACAPIAYVPLILIFSIGILTLAGRLIGSRLNILLVGILALVAFTPPALCILAMFRTPIQLLGAVTHCGWGRQILLAIILPIAWLILAILTLVLIPGTVALIGIIVLSFRG